MKKQIKNRMKKKTKKAIEKEKNDQMHLYLKLVFNKPLYYRSELRPIAKTILSTLILTKMLRLNGAAKGDGFKRYVKPYAKAKFYDCDNWCEEFLITAKEFYAALDNIGCNIDTATEDELQKSFVWYKNKRNTLQEYTINQEAVQAAMGDVAAQATTKTSDFIKWNMTSIKE